MSQHKPRSMNDLEEAAQGHELFRAPGSELQREQARDQAEASGWLPDDVAIEVPAVETHDQIVNRRQDLYDAMRRLEASVGRASRQTDWALVVDDALANLEFALRRHISEIEVSGGLFDDVIDRAPHLMSGVVELRRDHEDLLSSCRSARALLPGSDADVVRRKVLGILGRLAIHRQLGSELLFDAYNVDLAAAD